MEKLIIENRTDLPMSQAIEYANAVINKGKISKDSKGDMYCYLTMFERRDMDVFVSAFKNKKSDRLVVWSREKGATK